VIDPGLIANPGNISIAITLTGMGVSPSNAVPLAVNPHTSTACALFGLYHFLFTGFDSNGPVTAVGAFGVDANGNVDGAEDFVDAPNIFGPPVNQSGEGQNMFTGGQCTNSATPNQGSLTFSFIGFDLIPETFTYTFVLEQGGGGTPRGRLVESNDVADQSRIVGTVSGSGVFVEAQPDQSLSGDYAFGLVGTDPSGGRMSQVGRFTDSNGNLSAGVADINNAGTVTANVSFTGTTPLPPDVFSRVSLNRTIGGQQDGWVVYVNSSGGGFALDVTSSGGSPYSALAGVVSSQANPGAYNDGNLNAALVFSTWGVVPGSPASSDTTVGLASGFNSGAGTFNLQFDQMSGGVGNLNQSATATYSVASNGRATASYTLGGNTVDYVFYLDNSNDGFILGESGTTAEFGFFQPQAPGPFTTSTINGTFASATFLPMMPASPNLATEITLNNGTLSANTPAGALAGTYTVSASGRGTASVNLPVLGGSSLVLYVISPTSVEVMGSDNTTADAITFMH